MVQIPIGYVGVVISFIGMAHEDVSGVEFKHGDLVNAGHKGVWVAPLYPGKHPINTRVMRMELAATASTTCDLFFSIGTSTVVYPAASLPFEALRSGATVVEVNPQSTPFTAQAHFALVGAAGVVLPELVKAIKTGFTG
jgi:hypothetical protein